MILEKYKLNPILRPNKEHYWENLCVLNPAVIYDEKDQLFKMIYRAAGNDYEHYIYLGLAVSKDGFEFERVREKPVLSPTINGADGGCCEDPRLFELGGYYYLTYASRTFPPGQYWKQNKKVFGFKPEFGPRMLTTNNSITYLAVSSDLVHWKKLGRITDSRYDDRDVIVFWHKESNRFCKISRPYEWCGEGYPCKTPSIWISFGEDMMEWEKPEFLFEGSKWWEDKKIGGSTNVIDTKYGYLLTYHGVSTKDDCYRIGALMLDHNDPRKIIAQTNNPIMVPEFQYENEGFYNGCVFPCSIVIKDGKMFWYYGTADKYVCVATCDYEEFLDKLMKGEL